MAYRMHLRPKFDPSAKYVATNRLPVFNGVPMVAGDTMPLPPKDPAKRLKYLQDLRQLYDMRRIEVKPPKSVDDKNKQPTKENT